MAYYPERAETPWVPEGAAIVVGPPVDSLRYDAHATRVFCDWIGRSSAWCPGSTKGFRAASATPLRSPRRSDIEQERLPLE
jgi:hypothetical protein